MSAVEAGVVGVDGFVILDSAKPPSRDNGFAARDASPLSIFRVATFACLSQ